MNNHVFLHTSHPNALCVSSKWTLTFVKQQPPLSQVEKSYKDKLTRYLVSYATICNLEQEAP